VNRPRKRDKHLPPCVYMKHGAYYLVRNKKWTRLGSDLHQALVEYARLVSQSGGTMPQLIRDMMPRVLRDKRTGKAKSAETQRQYKQIAALLSQMLAPLSPSQMTPRDVKTLIRELSETPSIANRAVTVLSLVMEEAVDDEIIASNPCTGIKRMVLAARTRRMTTDEFGRIHAHADPLLRATMSLCYATGQRVMDVANIRAADIGDDGIMFRQQKTHAELIVAWTPDLRDAVAAARALKPNALRPPFLFGFRAPTYAMIRKRWVAAVAAARVSDVTLHDIRAMAATDAREQGIDAQVLLGHTDARTTRIYLRDRVVPVTRGPVMKRGKAA
jgi:integrase